MTIEQSPARFDSQAFRAIRARQLTDPLGAAGFRRPRVRIAAETRARRTLFVIALLLQLGILGAIATSRQPEAAPVVAEGAAPPVIATGGGAPAVAVQETPHTRTRSS